VLRRSADPAEQLAFGDRTTLLDLDPSLAPVVLVVGADVVREVLDNLAGSDQQQVVVARQRMGDLIKEGPVYAHAEGSKAYFRVVATFAAGTIRALPAVGRNVLSCPSSQATR